MDGVKAPSPDKPDIKVLDKAQTAALLEAAEGKAVHLLILLAVTTGMLRGEMLALHWSDIDFESANLEVSRALAFTKVHGLEFTKPKSEAGKRIISLPNITVNELHRHRTRQSELFLKISIRPGNNALVFTTTQGNNLPGPQSPRAVSNAFTEFIKGVDIPQISLNGLRHNQAHYNSFGVSMPEVIAPC